MEPIPNFLDIPDQDYQFHKLVFNGPSGALAVLMRARQLRPPMERLFVRYRGAAAYTPVGEPNPDVSASSVASAESLPVLAYVLTEWIPNNCGVGGNPVALELFNLEMRQVVQTIKPEELHWPDTYENCWLSEVIGFGGERTVYVVGGGMGYSVFELDLRSKSLTALARLQQTFY